MNCAGVGELCRGWWTVQGLVNCQGLVNAGVVNCAGVGELSGVGELCRGRLTVQRLVNCAEVGELCRGW